ncbi:unnamed protein product [Gadus morhua 'NCC']
MSSSLCRLRDLGVSEGLVGTHRGVGLAVNEAGDWQGELVGCCWSGSTVWMAQFTWPAYHHTGTINPHNRGLYFPCLD